MPSLIQMSRFAVVGLGLLGGSLAKRLRELGARDVFGIARRQAAIDQALAAGIISAGHTDPARLLPVADLTFLCLPLTACSEFVQAHGDSFRRGSIVVDVGSVKDSIVRELRAPLLARGVYFLGCHPMAGSEKSGLDEARAELYRDAIVFLTPTPEDEPEMISLVRKVWQEIGAVPIELPAARHDAAVARSSHVPHLLAAALARQVLGQGDVEAQRLAAAGAFRDMTRVAASDSAMWVEICRHNRAAVLAALDELTAECATLRQALAAADDDRLAARLGEARGLRQEWFAEYGQARGYGQCRPNGS